ncbi:MAG: hypothetical protein JXB34_04045 [Bacteroidales bacterium]|nr:hypothetical protein [Bacteroidales bacterium]
MNCKQLLYLWLIFVVFSGVSQAQTYTDRIERSFKIVPKSSVEVVNKYGKVHIRTWDKDSVRFEVDLRIQTTSREKMNKLKNQISFDFTSTNYYIIAKTSFVKSGGIFSDVVETFVPSNEVSINYVVYIPKHLPLKVENKFGDVYIDDFQGNFNLTLSNGNLKANYLQGNSKVALSSANGVINQIDNGKIEVAYSDIEIKNAGKIDIDSRSSVVNINQSLVLKVLSRRDKYYIDNVNKISGSGDFTTFKIIGIGQELNLILKYGGLSVEEVSNAFSLINIGSVYTDIDLVFTKPAAYFLDITHFADVRLIYPAAVSDLQTQDFNSDQRLLLTFGKMGYNVTSSSPKVKIMAEKKCYINIMHR